MNIDFNKNDSQVGTLTVNIAKSDYIDQFDEEIRKQRKNAHLKGFRKGKTPVGYVKKLYGDQVLANLVNDKAVSSIYDYLKENKIDTILDPILAENQDIQEMSYKNLKDFTFTFEVALSPEFEIGGITASDEFTRYNVLPSDKELKDNLERVAEQLGENITIKEDIQEKDIITLMADVLLTDEEGLTEPIEAEIKVLISDTTAAFQEMALKSKLNDEMTVKMSDLEAKDEAFVRKYYLKLEADDLRSFDDEIKASITNVERMQPMEVGEALYKKMFPQDDLKTEEEVLTRLREQATEEHLSMSSNVLYRSVMEQMMENTQIEMPDDFLMQWAKRAQVLKEGADEEKFLDYLKNDIKWNLIKGKLIKKYEIKVDEEEIYDRAKEQVKGYFGYKVTNDDPYIDMIAKNLMDDKEQRTKLWDETVTLKMYKAVEADLNIVIEEKTVEDFYKIVEEINKKQKD